MKVVEKEKEKMVVVPMQPEWRQSYTLVSLK
jgi:hypothetical protein